MHKMAWIGHSETDDLDTPFSLCAPASYEPVQQRVGQARKMPVHTKVSRTSFQAVCSTSLLQGKIRLQRLRER